MPGAVQILYILLVNTFFWVQKENLFLLPTSSQILWWLLHFFWFRLTYRVTAIHNSTSVLRNNTRWPDWLHWFNDQISLAAQPGLRWCLSCLGRMSAGIIYTVRLGFNPHFTSTSINTFFLESLVIYPKFELIISFLCLLNTRITPYYSFTYLVFKKCYPYVSLCNCVGPQTQELPGLPLPPNAGINGTHPTACSFLLLWDRVSHSDGGGGRLVVSNLPVSAHPIPSHHPIPTTPRAKIIDRQGLLCSSDRPTTSYVDQAALVCLLLYMVPTAYYYRVIFKYF